MADELSTNTVEEIAASLAAGITFLSSGNTKHALAHFNMAAEFASNTGVNAPGVDESGMDLSATEKRRLSITNPTLLQLCTEVYYYQALVLQQLRVYDESIKSYKVCVNISMKIQSQSFAALCFVGLADCHQELGDINNEVRNLKMAQHLYREMRSVKNEGFMCTTLARAYLSDGDGHLCVQYIREAQHLCQRISSKRDRGQLLSECGWIYSNMRMFEEALACLQQALSFSRQNSQGTASILQNIGAVYNEMELYSEALTYHQQAASLYERFQKPSSECKCWCNLAFAHSKLGDHNKAMSSYTTALTKARINNDHYLAFQASEGLGAIHFALGQTAEAEQFFKESLSVLDNIESDTGLARERVMEKLSCVHEAASNSKKEHTKTVPKNPKPVKRLDSVDADLTAYMTSYAKESSVESVQTPTPEAFSSPPQEEPLSETDLPATPQHVREGSLALGERAREIYTTLTLPGDPVRPVTQIISLEEPLQIQTVVRTNTSSRVCTIL